MACCTVRIFYATAYLALQYVCTSISGRKLRTLHRVAHDASAIVPVKKGRKRKDGEGKARCLEKRAVSPSMLLSRDKAEDADMRAYRVPVIICNFLPQLGFSAWLNKKEKMFLRIYGIPKWNYMKLLMQNLGMTSHILLRRYYYIIQNF